MDVYHPCEKILILRYVPWSGDRETVRKESFNTVKLFLYVWTFIRENETGNFSLWLFGDGYIYVKWKNWILSSIVVSFISKKKYKRGQTSFFKVLLSDWVYKISGRHSVKNGTSFFSQKKNIRWLKVISKDKKKLYDDKFWSNWNLSQWVITRFQIWKNSKRSIASEYIIP